MSKPSRTTVRDYSGSGFVGTFPASGLSYDIWNNALATSLQDYAENIAKWAAGGIVQAEDYATLSAAITAIGATPKTLIVASAINVSNTAEAVTIPATLSILPVKPGVINANGYTLTINGPVVGNPMHQWLNGFAAGDVKFGAGGNYVGPFEVWLEWFGGIGDGSTDNSTAMAVWLKSVDNSALGFVPKSLRAGLGRFNYSTTLTPNQDVQSLYILGVIPRHFRNTGFTTEFNYTGNGFALVLGTQNANDNLWDTFTPMYNITLRNIGIRGTASAAGGIKAAVGEALIEDVQIQGFSATNAYGLNIAGISNRLNRVYFTDNYYGISHIGNENTIENGQFQNNAIGILDRFCNVLRIKDNLFQGHSSYAIDAQRSSQWGGNVAGGLIITGNHFEDNQDTAGLSQVRVNAPSVSYIYDGVVIRNNEFHVPGNVGANHIIIGPNVRAMDPHFNFWKDGGLLTVPRVFVGNGETHHDMPSSDNVDLAKTSDDTLIAGKHNYHFGNYGAAASVTFTLPYAQRGLRFHIYKLANFDLILQCPVNNTIQNSDIAKKYKNISAEAYFAKVTLIGAGFINGYWRWLVESQTGTWAVDNS